MVTVILPTSLRERSGGERQFPIEAATAGEALRNLEREVPEVAGWVLDEQGRLRQHIKLFCNDTEAGMDTPVGAGDELFVVRAISGGKDAGVELLVGTQKGLIILGGPRSGPMEIVDRVFPGQTVEYAVRDPRNGRTFASVTHGQHGPRLFFRDRGEKDWQQAEGPVFPAGAESAVERIWTVEPGVEEGVLWAGVAPAALFRSEDDGRTWSLNQGLWDQPSRPKWQPGAGGMCLHSICPWPGEAQRLAVGISAVGVWVTDDGGATWECCNKGLVPRYLPEEARDTPHTHCVHDMQRAPLRPETLFMQFHGGVYRSDDGARSWREIGADSGLPADFGFPLVIDPSDPESAYVIPMTSDEDRVTAEGKVRVYETRDGGASWQARGTGLPDADAYLTILRQAFCADGRRPLGLYFGARSGEVFGSADGGATWSTVAAHLPPVLSVRSAS